MSQMPCRSAWGPLSSRLSLRHRLLSQGLAVMDATSIAMCRDNRLPIVVFNLNTTGNIMRMSMGEAVGTVIE